MLSNMTISFSTLLSCRVFCGGGLFNVFKSSLDVFEASVFSGFYGMWSDFIC